MTQGGGASRPRLRLLPTLLLTVAILALPTVVYAWGRSSSSFDIRRVTVTGTRVEPQPRVQRLLRREFRGKNLFAVTAADVRRALARLDYVEAATVDRDFPHTLRVRVVEHRPRAYALAGDRWYVLADDGYVICAAGRAPVAGANAAEASPPATRGATGAAGDKAGASATKKAESSAPEAAEPSAKAEPAATASAAGESSATASPAPAIREDDPDAAAPTAATTVTAVAGDQPRTGAELQALLEKGPAGADLALPSLAYDGPLSPGRVVEDRAVTAALAVLGGLPARIRRHVDVVEIEGRQLSLLLEDGLVVVWGSGERSLAKTVALEVVLERYRRAGRVPTSIDVAVPDTVLAKPILK